MGLISRVKTWIAGEILTAADLNAEIDNILNNLYLVGSDANGDTYYRIAGQFARLAKGAANTHKVMNAAGTAPEWATIYKIGSGSRAMDADTADVAYTGVGFKPAAIIFISYLTTSVSIGFGNGTDKVLVSVYSTTPVYDVSSTYSMRANEDAAKFQGAVVKTMDADGFTLTWTKGSTPASANATFAYLALR